MPYLIDSDWVIDHLDGVTAAVSLLNRLSTDGIAISIITYMEVYQGVIRSPNVTKSQREFDHFLNGVVLLTLTPAIAQRCAQLRHQLKRQGKRVNARALDLIIAATALEHKLTLVTRNIADYSDIPNLKLYQTK